MAGMLFASAYGVFRADYEPNIIDTHDETRDEIDIDARHQLYSGVRPY
jgi:hypothetical protein